MYKCWKLELVTVRTFDNSIQAHLLKSKLESEDITCYLFDENIVGLNPLYNITVGGIKLKIHKADIDRAAVIIQEVDQSALTNDQIVIRKKFIAGSSQWKGSREYYH